MKKLLFILLLLTGCTSFEMPADFEARQVETGGFDISVWQKISNPQGLYYVYIEGDGNAFNAHGLPTSDPTPKSSFMRELAAENISENVVYVARPCQFSKGKRCEQKYWTDARFAPEVVEAEYQAIKAVVGNAPVVLVGYSGGAQIAGLIAVNKDLNVMKVVTIAGNLNHETWSGYHNLPALTQSLNLADYKDKFLTIKQVHYVGEDDEVVPPALTKEFVGNQKTIRTVPNATHDKGWDKLQISTD